MTLSVINGLLAGFEDFRSAPYRDQGGVPTIGYGSTMYENGTKVTMNDTPISKARALEIKSHFVLDFWNKIKGMITSNLNENQITAILSLVYNIGVGNFAGSTLLRKLNADPNDPSIAYEFSRWNKVRIDGKLTVSNGLVTRRKKESDLYFKKKVVTVCPHCCLEF